MKKGKKVILSFGDRLKSTMASRGISVVELQEKSGLSGTIISNYRTGKTCPNERNKDKISKLLFDKSETAQKREFDIAWRNFETQRSAPTNWNDKRYSTQDLWNAVFGTQAPSFAAILKGSSPNQKFGGFEDGDLNFIMSAGKFYLDYPTRLREAVKDANAEYTLHDDGPTYFSDSKIDTSTFDLNGPFPDGEMQELIDKYRDRYTDILIANFKSGTKKRYYNHKQVGIWSVDKQISKSTPERTHATVQCYETDYFTRWIMGQVYKELYFRHPIYFQKMNDWPHAEAKDKTYHFPHLVAGSGLNCFVILHSSDGDFVAFTRLQNVTANAHQHHKYHLAANEGLTPHDTDPNDINKISLSRIVVRMFLEEIGGFNELHDKDKYVTTDLFVDIPSGEFGILGVIEVNAERQTLNNFRDALARDAHEEFVGSFEFVPATKEGVARFILNQPRGVHSVTSYLPGVTNLLIGRGVFPD